MNLLNEILRRIAASLPRPPVVVFDLDSTLYDIYERGQVIFREAVASFPALGPALQKLADQRIGWDFLADFRWAGLTDEMQLQAIHAFWQERFFSDSYHIHDRPMPGAVDFVNRVHRAGAIICYLTGRDWPNMKTGTVASLRRYGFPLDTDRVRLLMKDSQKQPDAEHKRAAIVEIRRLGEVIAAFDNEPELVNLFFDSFPGALVVWVDSIHSPTPVVPYPAIMRIDDFQMHDNH